MGNASDKPDSLPAGTARSLSDDWYLKAYGIEESRFRYHRRRLVAAMTNLRNVGIAVLVGVCVGLSVATVRKPQPSRFPVLIRAAAAKPTVSAAPVTAATHARANTMPAVMREAAASPAELERIKVRNRRLEALVAVLRERKRTPEKRAAPDPSNLFGQ